jgi:hypothetical protein
MKLEEQVLNELFPIEKALISISIKGKILSEYNNEDKKELAKLLIRLSYFVGIKEAPSIDQLKMLVPFLIISFPKLTQDQMEHAFQLYCANEMEQIEHYQNFSPIFISKVIKSYTELKNRAKIKYRKISERIQNEVETAKKAQEYNPLHGAYEALLLEYTDFVNEKYIEPNETQKYKSYVCLRLCHRVGLFKEVPFDLNAYLWFNDFFQSIKKENYQQELKEYVRNFGKNI